MRLPTGLRRAIAYAKPLVPERVWPALLTARSLLGDGPVVAAPGFARPLVLAPHPDDEAIGCGGVIALAAGRGAKVTVAFATSGEATRGSAARPEVTAATREEEANRACALLGAAPPVFLRFPDGRMGEVVSKPGAGEFDAALTRLVDEAQPDAVLFPWFGDGHPDHAALTEAVLHSNLDPELDAWAYETWTPLPCNRLVDITSVLSQKQAAIDAYPTAKLAFDLDALIGLNRYRSVYGLMGRGYAEAFMRAPLSEHRRVSDATRPRPAGETG